MIIIYSINNFLYIKKMNTGMLEKDLPNNCYTDPNYPNDAICTMNLTQKIECNNIIKNVNDTVINTYYTKKDNKWTCNTNVGNCNIDQCKNIISYNGQSCVILSNITSNHFNDSSNTESALCINNNNQLTKYNYKNFLWSIKTDEPPILPPTPIVDIPDFNIYNYADDPLTLNNT